jgi:ABC-type polysaccharide/polyol phosphate transport system ATPase subunit
VIVSHSLGLLKEICDRIIVLENGEIVYKGDPGDAVEAYLQL